MRADNFVELTVLATVTSAQAFRSLLESEGVECLLDPSEPLAIAVASGGRGIKLLVPESELDRAQSILSDSEFSDQELTYLATAHPIDSVQEVQDRSRRPALVALNAIWFAIAGVGQIAFLAWLGICTVAEWELPTSANGSTPLDVFRRYQTAMLISVVWYPIASWGLWRGVSWVRHFVLGSWILLIAKATVPVLPAMPATILVKNVALSLITSWVLWWYLFRKRAVVAFFRSHEEPTGHAA
jgi:hypothetical protein